MEAKEGHDGSYAWKSILKGRAVIKRGVKWRVGIDQNLWWKLPNATLSGVHGPLLPEFQNATISSLINHHIRTWDLPLLYTAVSPTEAELVQKITLSRGQSDDVLFWPFVQSGNYSVKSNYYFLKSETRSTYTHAQAPPDHPKPPWKQIWKIHLLNKIKNFLMESNP